MVHAITATGTLSEPELPGIPGAEDFKGHTFHTSRWDHAYTGGTPDGGMTGLADKRVGIVGTGATGVQAIPMLAEDARHLYVFQRTPSTADVRANRRTTGNDVGAGREGRARERRENFLRIFSGEGAEQDLVADGWTSSAVLLEKLLPSFRRRGDREAFEAAHEIADAAKMNEIRARAEGIVADPDAAEKLKPWYRYACKRPTFSDTCYQAFNRHNVTLGDAADTHGIERMAERGVEVGDTEYEPDCLVFATGFSAGVSGGPLRQHGRGGVQLLHAWAQHGPRTRTASPATVSPTSSRGAPCRTPAASTSPTSWTSRPSTPPPWPKTRPTTSGSTPSAPPATTIARGSAARTARPPTPTTRSPSTACCAGGARSPWARSSAPGHPTDPRTTART
ncbi:hypothetical protein GCM10023079_55190 [Streptomyces chitinivorans]